MSMFGSSLTKCQLLKSRLAPLSLLLAVDPSPHLTGRDRLPWICEVVPIATTFALALADRLSLDLP